MLPTLYYYCLGTTLTNYSTRCTIVRRNSAHSTLQKHFNFHPSRATVRRRMSETTTFTAAPNANSSGSQTVVTIDGSQGEGGGQILRNSVAYASILKKPLHIHSIRSKRSKPGLQAQHCTAIEMAAKLGGGVLEGATLQSTEITYQPPPPAAVAATATTTTTICSENDPTGQAKSENNSAEERTVEGIVQTAGSICLLLQAALPCALFGLSQGTTTNLVLKGGTNASMAPQYDYWERVFLPTFQEWLGVDKVPIQATLLMRGYFPKGGGHVEVKVPSLQHHLPLPPLQLTERGHLNRIQIRSFHAGKLPKHLATTMGRSAKEHLEKILGADSNGPAIDVEIVSEQHAVGSGLGILLVATTTTGCRFGGSTLCAPKQRAVDAGKIAAQELLDTLNDRGCVDEWMQDQLIIFMALAEGVSTILTGSLTLHTQTAIQVAEQLVAGVKFSVQRLDNSENHGRKKEESGYGQDGRISGKHLITCHGIGYSGI